MMVQMNEKLRLEHEAKHVLDMPFANRKPYLVMVGTARGKQARAILEAEIVRQHGLRRANA